MRNTLYYGDNLDVLRDFPAEFVDLIYLDPPFNSNRSYNVLFRDESGQEADAQITAFADTWHWNVHTEQLYRQLVTQADEPVSRMIEAMRQFIGPNQMMAYLVMMAARLVELRRVLKPTGSLYLHCDPTASHYLKVVLDTVFGVQNYRNEIVWKRTNAHNDAARKFPDVSDIIFFYSKSSTYTFNVQHLPYSDQHIANSYRNVDANGRRYASRDLRSPNPRPNLTYDYKGYKPHQNGWSISRELMEKYDREGRLIFPSSKEGRIRLKVYLDEMPGVPASNVWDDIPPIQASAAERLGYPTQKPVALLERILQASSNPGDLVLDPFCGCGTTIAAAQRLGRRWIGIDITHLSIALQKYRLKNAFGLEPGRDYAVKGEPVDFASARQLAEDDRYQFQWWALSLIEARPLGGSGDSKEGKKGADKGIDGIITFMDDSSGKARRAVVQVKSGRVSSRDIRDLVGTIDREKAPIGIFVTLRAPTSDMREAAAAAGLYHSPGWNQDYPRIQILTVHGLLEGRESVKMPPSNVTFKQAGKMLKEDGPPQMGFTFEGDD